MPYLMVNLDDPADCRRGLEQLRGLAGPNRGGPRGRCGPPPRQEGRVEGGAERHRRSETGGPAGGDLHDLPVMQKLRRIRQRGIWEHLQRVAAEVHQPLSLPEIDAALGLATNKMRSLKAIMGKLERRWGLEFLVPDPHGSVDASGNPRYVMPQELRKKIVKLSV